MYYSTKLFLLLALTISPLVAFDNEIVIEGRVVDGVSIDILELSQNKDNIYLFTNSESGARITVKELSVSSGNRNILNNGLEYSLPLVYDLFDNSSFLGTSTLPIERVILGIDISVH